MAKNQKETFTVKVGDKTLSLAVKRPDASVYRDAQMEYNKTFGGLLKGGALLRAKLASYMRDQNLWNEELQKRHDDLVEKINDNEKKLKQGGIKLKEAKKLALEMRDNREALRALVAERTQLDSNTAEGQSENARFNCLVARCLVYDDSGKPYFNSLDDYLNNAGEPVAFEGATRLGTMLYGLDSNYEANLPENQFLKKFKFIDEKLRIVNEDGKLVDSDGRLIDEEGRYIDGEGGYVDRDGNPLTKEGDYAFDTAPFLDDDGKPIEDEVVEETKTEKA